MPLIIIIIKTNSKQSLVAVAAALVPLLIEGSPGCTLRGWGRGEERLLRKPGPMNLEPAAKELSLSEGSLSSDETLPC